MTRPIWGTDGEISKPGLPPQPVLVDLAGSGFVFTSGGIAHNVTQADLEELAQPTFGPMFDPGS